MNSSRNRYYNIKHTRKNKSTHFSYFYNHPTSHDILHPFFLSILYFPHEIPFVFGGLYHFNFEIQHHEQPLS
jgi:hypothetical protein